MAEPLSRRDRRLFVVLGAPSMGLSFATTVLATYLPVLARAFTGSTTVIGALVGGEGFVALLLPIWIGAWSDRVDTRLGRRLPFVLVTGPLACAALALLPFAPSLLVLAIAVGIFYLGYFTYYAPYRALYADLVPKEKSGRAQGVAGIFREAGLGGALVGGSLLLGLWRPLPFLLAAFTLAATTVTLAVGLRHTDLRRAPSPRGESALAQTWSLLRDHRDIRWFAVGNALWETTLGGLKAFIVLYLTRGLGKSMLFSAAVMGVVAAVALVASPLAGKLADRYGAVHVMKIALLVFGLGLLVPAVSTSATVLVAALPFIGFGAVTALTLPYALLMRMMPAESHGAAAGLYDVSGGVGTLLGPLLTGAAIDALGPLFSSTKGYGAMWPVISAAALLGILALQRTGRK
jgi:MFS family permease